jgi:hypothetical protein
MLGDTVRHNVQEAVTYLALLVGQVPHAERLYAAVAVPALLDPALGVPAMVVIAAP